MDQWFDTIFFVFFFWIYCVTSCDSFGIDMDL